MPQKSGRRGSQSFFSIFFVNLPAVALWAKTPEKAAEILMSDPRLIGTLAEA